MTPPEIVSRDFQSTRHSAHGRSLASVSVDPFNAEAAEAQSNCVER